MMRWQDRRKPGPSRLREAVEMVAMLLCIGMVILFLSLDGIR